MGRNQDLFNQCHTLTVEDPLAIIEKNGKSCRRAKNRKGGRAKKGVWIIL